MSASSFAHTPSATKPLMRDEYSASLDGDGKATRRSKNCWTSADTRRLDPNNTCSNAGCMSDSHTAQAWREHFRVAGWRVGSGGNEVSIQSGLARAEFYVLVDRIGLSEQR